jgi:hypothetical protein
MKTTLTAIVLLAALVPNLAVAGGIIKIDMTPTIDSHIDVFPDKPQITPPLGGPLIEVPNQPNKPIIHKVVLADVLLACAVRGTPSEFPDDLVITNLGLKTIDSGSQLKWTTKSPKLHGIVTLTQALAPGQSIKLNGVLEGGLSPDTQCRVQLL